MKNSLANLNNISKWLRINMKDIFKLNELNLEIEITKEIPDKFNTKWIGNTFPITIEPRHILQTLELVQNNGFEKASKRTLIDAIKLVGLEERFNPIKEYFESLKWDGKNRLDHAFTEFLGCEDNEYIRTISKITFMQIANRALNPGCEINYILILKGEQGIKKTSFINALAPKREWAASSLYISLRNIESDQYIVGKLIIEMSDLVMITENNTGTWEKIITKRFGKVRCSYNNNVASVPRTAILFMTSNSDLSSDKRIKNMSGDLKFLQIEVDQMIDVENFCKIREQIFAEAVHRIKSGEKYENIIEFDEKFKKQKENKNTNKHPWMNIIKEYTIDKEKVSVDEIRKYAIKIDLEKWTPSNIWEVTDCLKELGFSKKKTRTYNIWIR